MTDFIALFLSLGLIIFLAYKGYSTIITAPLLGLATILMIHGGDSHLMVNYTEIYMSGFANFVKSYFPLFLTGAIFAKLMDAANFGNSIAHFITKKIGPTHAILAVVLSGAFLTYGGVSLFVVAFILYPIANLLYKEANLPKRLIPGSIALGAFTFTMTALPGSPQIQNVIPMSYFGTDAFAAPLIGIIASILMFSLGMLWLNISARKARRSGEGYGNFPTDQMPLRADPKDLPPILLAIMPILIIFIVNLYLSKIYYPNVDGTYLNDYGLSLTNVAGTWSVIIAIVLGIVFILVTQFKKLCNLRDLLSEGITNSFLPLMSSSAIVGYGSIIKSLAVFTLLQSAILNLSSNPIISEALSVNIICGITASASGGIGITLDALAPTYLSLAHHIGLSPEILHRIASLASGGLDTLPHNGAVITTLAICGLTHKESYKDIFITSVVIPIVVTILIVTFIALSFS